MSSIKSPEDVNDPVQLLPQGQLPFSSECPLSHELQSIFFHYDVSYAAVAVLVDNDFTKRKTIKRADPEGDDDQRALFATIAEQLNPLQRVLMRDAFIRILNGNSLAAVVTPPPKKKSKKDPAKSSDKTAAAAAAAAAKTAAKTSSSSSAVVGDPSAAAKSAASTPAKKSVDDDDDDVGDDDDDDDDEDADSVEDSLADGAASSDSKPSKSSRQDLNSLFDDVSNEVNQC